MGTIDIQSLITWCSAYLSDPAHVWAVITGLCTLLSFLPGRIGGLGKVIGAHGPQIVKAITTFMTYLPKLIALVVGIMAFVRGLRVVKSQPVPAPLPAVPQPTPPADDGPKAA